MSAPESAAAELRSLVREVLADALAAQRTHPPAGPTSPARPLAVEPDWSSAPGRSGRGADDGGGDGLDVRVDSDADLHALVVRVLDLAADPGRAADLRSGRLRLRLAARTGRGLDREPERASVRRIERGAVTEAAVRAAAQDGQRLVLGRRAVLTPLARDRARSLGVVVERER